MKPPTRSRGFSLVELLVVVGILVVVGAIAVPLVSTTVRSTSLQSATEEASNSIKRLSAEAAGGGTRTTLDVDAIPHSDRVVIDSKKLVAPGGATLVSRIEFQAQTGSALVNGQPGRAAIVLSNADASDFAYGLVVGARGTLERYRYQNGRWEIAQ